MSQGRRINVEEARSYAILLMALLRPFTVAQKLCGSVRRGRTTADGLQLVVIPRMGEPSTAAEGRKCPNLLWGRVDELVRRPGPLGHAPPTRQDDGSLWPALATDGHRKLRWHNVEVDLYTATMASWGAMLLTRTGPPELSERWMSALEERGLQMKEGKVVDQAGVLVAVPSEQAAFELVRWPFVPLELRDGWARSNFSDSWLRGQMNAQPTPRSR